MAATRGEHQAKSYTTDEEDEVLRHAACEEANDVRSLQRALDSIVPPSSRRRAYDAILNFASSRPILFSFAAAQLALCFLPLLLFIVFAVSTVAFALGAALVFALFWIGVALLLLIPALVVASSVGVLVWAWAVGSFFVARWVYLRVPVGVAGGMRVDVAGKRVDVVKDEDGVEGEIRSAS